MKTLYDLFNESKEKLRKYSEIPYREKLVAIKDWLVETTDWQKTPLDLRNLAYWKPISGFELRDMAEMFPRMIIKRKSGHRVMAQTYTYYLFNIGLLEDYAKFLHVSQKQHIQTMHILNEEYIQLIPKDVLQNIAQNVLRQRPDLFQGNLTGRNYVPRLSLNDEYISDYTLAKVLPHEQTGKGIVFHRDGILEVLDAIRKYVRDTYHINITQNWHLFK